MEREKEGEHVDSIHPIFAKLNLSVEILVRITERHAGLVEFLLQVFGAVDEELRSVSIGRYAIATSAHDRGIDTTLKHVQIACFRGVRERLGRISGNIALVPLKVSGPEIQARFADGSIACFLVEIQSSRNVLHASVAFHVGNAGVVAALGKVQLAGAFEIVRRSRDVFVHTW